MNQILYTANTKKTGTLEIKTIVRIFSIAIILFGVILVGKGSYAMISNGENNNGTNTPAVEMKQEANTVVVKIKHDKAIDKIIYSWGQKQEYILQGKGRTEIEEKIDMPEGINNLILKVTDISGKTSSYSKQFETTNKDVVKPEIEFLVEGSKVKIVAKDETELDYIEYYWNNEDETRIEARENSPKQVEEKVTIVKGENTLTVVAVDKAGNEQTKEQTFKGAKKPTIELFRDGQELLVKVTDEDGIKKIDYSVNGAQYSTDPNNTGEALNVKEAEFRQPMVTGQNDITIKVYSINGLTEEVSGSTTI